LNILPGEGVVFANCFWCLFGEIDTFCTIVSNLANSKEIIKQLTSEYTNTNTKN